LANELNFGTMVHRGTYYGGFIAKIPRRSL
jgi:hypothetical protein